MAESDLPPTSGSNRRRHGRVRLQDITCSLGTLLDLSASGMRVRTRGSTPTTGTEFAVSIEGLEETIVLQCTVRWSKRTGLLSREVGLEFLSLNAETRRWLTALARTCAHNEFVRHRQHPDEDAA